MRARRAGGLAIAVGLLGACATSEPEPPPARVGAARGMSASHDFSFARGTPVGGTRLTACGRIILATTGTEPASGSAFAVRAAEPAAVVTFTFDRPIRQFDLGVSHLSAERRLLAFNVGAPPKLSGRLVQTADGQVTTDGGRGTAGGGEGAGTLSWPELEAVREIKLTVGGTGPGPLLERFGVACGP